MTKTIHVKNKLKVKWTSNQTSLKNAPRPTLMKHQREQNKKKMNDTQTLLLANLTVLIITKKKNSHSDSCCPKKITFDNQTSSVKFSPSFNLRSDKLSTPRQNRFDQSDSGYQTAKTQAQTQTVVDIEQTLNFDKISNASSFHSA